MLGTDASFGEMMRAAKEGGRWEESLVIVMSDTNVKDLGYEMNRVVLIIKRPGQAEGRMLRGPVTTQNLFGFLSAFFKDGAVRPERLRRR